MVVEGFGYFVGQYFPDPLQVAPETKAVLLKVGMPQFGNELVGDGIGSRQVEEHGVESFGAASLSCFLFVARQYPLTAQRKNLFLHTKGFEI